MPKSPRTNETKPTFEELLAIRKEQLDKQAVQALLNNQNEVIKAAYDLVITDIPSNFKETISDINYLLSIYISRFPEESNTEMIERILCHTQIFKDFFKKIEDVSLVLKGAEKVNLPS